MRVLVCGSRTYSDIETLHATLDGWLNPEDVVVQGEARGADMMAKQWAVVNGNDFERFPADWATHGKAAGFIRNDQMLDTKPDLVIAFTDKPLLDSHGTRHTVAGAKKRGIKAVVVWTV